MDGSSRVFLTLDQIDELLEQPYWVVDILPEQVPANSPGQYFAVEDYYLKKPRIAALHRKFAEILLKLNCYFDLSLGAVTGDAWIREAGTAITDHVPKTEMAGVEQNPEAEMAGTEQNPEAEIEPAGILWTRNPDPEELAGTICSADGIWTLYVYFPAEDSLIFINCDDIYMTEYHPTVRLLDLMRQLAAAEGLFVRKPEQP